MNTFDEIREYLSNIPHISHGGCGVAALSMNRWRKSHGLKPLDYVFLYVAEMWEDGELEENNLRLQDRKISEAQVPDHIGLLDGGLVIDCEGTVSSELFDTEFIVEEFVVIELLKFPEKWNPRFDRSLIKEIENSLGIGG